MRLIPDPDGNDRPAIIARDDGTTGLAPVVLARKVDEDGNPTGPFEHIGWLTGITYTEAEADE